MPRKPASLVSCSGGPPANPPTRCATASSREKRFTTSSTTTCAGHAVQFRGKRNESRVVEAGGADLARDADDGCAGIEKRPRDAAAQAAAGASDKDDVSLHAFLPR